MQHTHILSLTRSSSDLSPQYIFLFPSISPSLFSFVTSFFSFSSHSILTHTQIIYCLSTKAVKKNDSGAYGVPQNGGTEGNSRSCLRRPQGHGTPPPSPILSTLSPPRSPHRRHRFQLQKTHLLTQPPHRPRPFPSRTSPFPATG